METVSVAPRKETLVLILNEQLKRINRAAAFLDKFSGLHEDYEKSELAHELRNKLEVDESTIYFLDTILIQMRNEIKEDINKFQ